MLDKLKGIIGKNERKRRFRRVSGDFRLCVVVIETDKKTGIKKHGNCFIVRVQNFSAGGLCVYHGNYLMEGEEVEIGNKHTIKKMDCLKCPNMSLTIDDFAGDIIRGRVVWRTHKLSGIRFTEIRKADEAKLNDKAINKLSGGR
jgi:hypothetical protein